MDPTRFRGGCGGGWNDDDYVGAGTSKNSSSGGERNLPFDTGKQPERKGTISNSSSGERNFPFDPGKQACNIFPVSPTLGSVDWICFVCPFVFVLFCAFFVFGWYVLA